MVEERMTGAERQSLMQLARQRARVAKQEVAAREAELLADVEAQLSAIYEPRDEAWKDITKEADRRVKEWDNEIAAICAERGIDPKLRPGLHLSWYGRGESADKDRRAELRKTAQTKVKAIGQSARLAIERESVNVQTQLVAAGLTTGEAHSFLDSMPTPEALMPAISVKALEAAHADRNDADG